MIRFICGKCGALLRPAGDIAVTETIEVPKDELIRGIIFANRYEIIEELGRGGMGRVYRAYDKQLEKAVSLFSVPKIQSGKVMGTFSWSFIDYADYLYPLAWAYYLSGDLEKARKQYEAIIGLSAGRMYSGDLYARSFYMLGKIYEQQGKKGKARENYHKFLDIWKDADPGIAEVVDARDRLAGLKGQ